jgi:exodeoxyribonuclease-1
MRPSAPTGQRIPSGRKACIVIGEPLVIYCQPADDTLPQPEACCVTGITPQLAAEKGVPEAEFIALIHEQMAQADTCTVGYNNLRFDDEVTRNLQTKHHAHLYG